MNPQDRKAQQKDLQNQETVEFQSSMPDVDNQDVEFIPDQQLEEQIEEQE
ncbi:MAG TPA: hypothetical protein V6D47_00985 [Oscillatoriaceae cyanobacterium]